MEQQTKAILVVSFGTSHEDARRKNIEKIEQEIAESFQDYRVYRAWTSNVIRRILKKRDGLEIDSVEEAFARMKADGIREVIVQPTHVLNGIENEQMCGQIRSWQKEFDGLRIGTPLLTSQEDVCQTARILAERWKELGSKEALVLMGHGTPHYANSVYAALDNFLKDGGQRNLFIGTVEAYPSMETLLRRVKEYDPERVHIAPFMIVAGEHAKNDMAGDQEDSWKNQFQRAGYEVVCHVEGLGELEGIRKMFVRHVREAQ